MPRLSRLAQALRETGAPSGALVVTDGRLPRVAGVTCVDAVGPESALGGPLSLVRDGDRIVADLAAGALSTEAASEGRSAALAPAASLPPALSKYVRTVQPAHRGATTHPGAAAERVRYADI
jgi:dihydroxy-acid dehydratase